MGYEDWRDHDSSDPDGMHSFLETLIKLAAIEGEVLEVATQCMGGGYDSLTPKQQQVFDRSIIDTFTRTSCACCGGHVPWSEMYDAYDKRHRHLQESSFCVVGGSYRGSLHHLLSTVKGFHPDAAGEFPSRHRIASRYPCHTLRARAVRHAGDVCRLQTLHIPAVRVSSDIEAIGPPPLAAIVPVLSKTSARW